MGGRPTRPVRLQPTGTATFKNGLIHINDESGNLECTLSTDIDPMHHHWSNESSYFQEELDTWQSFRKYQQNVQPLDHSEAKLELNEKDAALVKILTKLSDWQEFETFQHRLWVGTRRKQDWRRQHFLEITELERITENPSTSSAAHYGIGPWLRLLDRSQEELEASKKQLDWIKDEWPKLVAECVESVSKSPRLQSVLEAKFRKQTYFTFDAILQLGGRPSHSISPPDTSMDDVQRILYWSSETSKFSEDLSEWKAFFEWRRRHIDDRLTTQPEGSQCPQCQSNLKFSSDFEIFRLAQHDYALAWVECWQRVARWYEEDDEMPDPHFSCDLEEDAKAAHLNVRAWEQKRADAATRLEEVIQERLRAHSGHAQSISSEMKQAPQESSPPTPPTSISGCPPSTQCLPPPSAPQISQSLPSPPSSQSPHSPRSPGRLSYNQKPSDKDKKKLAEKGHRRSKKEKARKERARNGNANTTQHSLPTASSDSHQVEEDDDIQMVDIVQEPHPVNTSAAEPKSAEPAVPTTKNPPTSTPPPPHPTIQQTLPEFPIHSHRVEKDDDIQMPDVSQNPNPVNTPATEPKSAEPAIPTTTNPPTTSSPPPRPHRTPTKKPTPQPPSSKKTQQPAPNLNRALSGQISKKKPSGQKPNKPPKPITDQQAEMLLAAVSTPSVPPRRGTRLRRTVTL